MRTMIVVELLAACGCTLGGMHFWRVGPLSHDAAAAPFLGRAGVAERDARVPAPMGASERGSVLREGPDDSSPDVPGKRERRIAEATGGDPQFHDASERSATAESAGSRAHPMPRAAPSSTAAIPPLAARGGAGREIPEQLARAALRFVGVDPAAEKTWAAAINQTSLSPDARSNLIEDLNEDGFPDPDKVTAADLSLVRARLRIIERLAPRAMDDVNAAAFQEAYKDLIDMLVRLGAAAPR